MVSRKVIFISDVHLGGSPEYDWLGQGGREEMTSFLGSLRRDRTISELVLLGDILDTWVFPDLGREPRTFAEILAAPANGGVVSALRELASSMLVTYVQGNHDMDAWGDLEPALEAELPGIAYERHGVARGPLWAEHGSRYAMFTAADSGHDAAHGLPLGYFITRVNETRGSGRGDDPTVGAVARSAVVDFGAKHLPAAPLSEGLAGLSLAETATAEGAFFAAHLGSWVLEAVARNANVALNTEVRLPRGGSVTLAEVRDRYADLYADWKKVPDRPPALHALMAEIEMMGPVANWLQRRLEKKAVLFGHTHRARCAPAAPSYLNDGCFLRDARRSPHVIEGLAGEDLWDLTLWSCDRNGLRTREASVRV